MKPLTDAEIRDSLVNAGPAEAERMPLPGLHEVLWSEREYLGWRDPGSPQRGYLAYWRDGRAVGVVLRASEARLQAGSAICSLCNTPQPAGQVTMFTAQRAGRGRRARGFGRHLHLRRPGVLAADPDRAPAVRDAAEPRRGGRDASLTPDRAARRLRRPDSRRRVGRAARLTPRCWPAPAARSDTGR